MFLAWLCNLSVSRLDTDDDFCIGYQNDSYYYGQQSFSELLLLGQSDCNIKCCSRALYKLLILSSLVNLEREYEVS